MLLVVEPSKYVVYDITSGRGIRSFEQPYKDSGQSAIFIHEGTGILGAYTSDSVRAWFVNHKNKGKIVTLNHSGKSFCLCVLS